MEIISTESRLKKFIFILIIGFLILPKSCSKKPGNSEIKRAIKSSLRKSVPTSWVGGILNKNPQIKSIKIIEVGKFNKEMRGYPVKVRITGHAELISPLLNKKVERPFNKNTEFKIYKDNYGDWIAEKFNYTF